MFQRRSLTEHKAIVLGVAVTLFFFGKIFYDIHADYRQALSGAEQRARGMASALNEHALRTFNDSEGTIDSVIRGVNALSPTGIPEEASLQQVFAQHRRPGSMIDTIFVASPRGRLHAVSTEFPVRQVPVADREYFLRHLNSTDPAVFISKPFRNRLNNEWLITASKRLSNPDGSLRMIVGVAIRTHYFSNFYSTLAIGKRDRILLVRRDGYILSLEPFSEQTLLRNLHAPKTSGPEFANYPGTGSYQPYTSRLDGTQRIVAYRSSPTYPVVALISLDRTDQLAHWRSRSLKDLGISGMFLALVAALGLLVRRQFADLREANRHLSQQKSELRQARRRTQEMVDSIDGIVWEVDLESSRFTFVSQRCEAITGLSAVQWPADREQWSGRIHPGDRTWADWFRPEAADAPRNASFEYRFRTKDGSYRWLRDIVSVVNDEGEPPHLRGVTLDITQAKKAEDALLEYRKAVECSKDMVSVLDRGYRFHVANQALLSYLRRERDDLVGRTLEEVLGAAHFAEVKPFLDTCLQGTASSLELKVDAPDGELRDLALSFYPVEESGVVSRAVCVARDCTESKRAERALRESEERFRRISDAVTDYIYTVQIGPDGEPSTRHGAGCLAVTGYSEEEFAQNTLLWLGMVADQDRERVRRHAGELIGPGPMDPIEHRIIRKDGQLRWVRNTPVPRFDGTGRLIEYEGLVQDITEQKLAEEALLRSEQRFRELMENIQLVSVILDTTGRISFCNDYLLQLTGWSREEAVGSDWFELFIPEEGRAEMRAFFARAVQSGELPGHFENPIVTRDGEYRTFSWDNTVLHHPDGSLAGLASIGRDLTRYRALEEQLRHSQKMEATGLLAGGVAHDFNNILTVIIGYCSIMQMRMTKEDPNLASVNQVLAAAERAAGLTRSLLAYSRKQVMNQNHVDLNAIVRHVEHFLCRVIGEDIALRVELHGEELPVMVDSGQIEQIIMNMATNARDAMPDGGELRIVTEAVELERESADGKGCAPGRYAVLTISDTGSGMDETVRQKIFEPFFTTKEVGKGTGLGLAMAYGTVMQHNGQISVESEPGAGTRFCIYLPISSSGDSLKPEEASLFQPHQGHELILVAEDEAAVRELVEGILTRFGYRVLLAKDGEEAVAKFARHADEVDLVLLDMIMPKMSGMAAYEEISRIKPGVRALFTSGYTADVIRSKGELGPGMELVMKPVHPHLLLRKVREMLDPKAGRPEPDAAGTGEHPDSSTTV